MIKIRQNVTHWLVFASILSLQVGCAGNMSVKADKVGSSSITPELKKSTNTAKKASKKPALKQAKVTKVPKEKLKSAPLKTQTELSGEILYYLLSAEIATQRGQVELSAALYTKAATITRDPRIAQQATRAAYYARDDKRAIAAATLWNELEPNNVEGHQVLAALLVRVGKTNAAAEHFEFVVTHGKQNERQRFMLIASMLSKEKDKKTALAVMQKLIAKRTNNPNALYAYSRLAFLLGNLSDAANTIKKVIAQEPRWTEAYILQSNIFIRRGDKAQALNVLQQAVETQADNAPLRMFYARNLVDAKQFEEAANQFSILTEDEKLEHEARFALGLLSLQMNKPKQSEGYFKQLLEDKIKVAESQYYLAQSYELQNALSKAVDAYQKVTDARYHFEAELRIAHILAKQGQLVEARLHLQNMSPDSLEKELRVYLTEGEILKAAKQYDEALALYTEALQQLTDNSRLLYARALVAEKLGNIDLAIKDLETVVQREPKDAQALNALGYTLVDKTKQLQRGLDYILQALKLEPNDAAIHDSLGWAYYRLGRYDEAVKYLRLAFEQLQDAEVAAHLGEALWVAGEREAAQEIWNTGLQQAPNDDLLLNVMQKFSK